nr:hypothetical protein [Myxococcales bacterium]
MLGRLIVGILKGLIVGGLIGFGLVKLGMAVPISVVAYIAAAVTGVVVGLIAGKPIWAKDAKIEAGMKAFVGALLGAGLMFAARRWIHVPLVLPEAATNALGVTRQIQASEQALTLSSFAMTSLAMVAAVLGGFYDADNTPEPEGEKQQAKAAPDPKANGKASAAPNKRIAPAPAEDEFDDDLDIDAGKKQAKK